MRRPARGAVQPFTGTEGAEAGGEGGDDGREGAT